MKKTLTEQWKNGELKDGIYYVSLRDSNDIHIRYLDKTKYSVYFRCFKEVLSPVPRYDEIKRLQEQLDIVTEQRDDIHIDKHVLQKQLNEANRIIKKLYKESGNPIGIDYLEKWGVK